MSNAIKPIAADYIGAPIYRLPHAHILNKEEIMSASGRDAIFWRASDAVIDLQNQLEAAEKAIRALRCDLARARDQRRVAECLRETDDKAALEWIAAEEDAQESAADRAESRATRRAECGHCE